MAARERVTADFADVFNESDEFDQEYNLLNPRFPFREIEMDIADFYKIIGGDNMFSNNPNRKLMRSVTVQTDPETSNIPPSWLLVGERLVDDLYTGLGNIINTMYPSDESCDQQDAMRKANINPAGMKYFKFVKGYWQSTLLPNIKIPDRVETDRQNRALCCEDTKIHLRHLFEVATKLRCVIPYLCHCVSRENEQSVDAEVPSCCLKGNSSSELQRSQSPRSGVHESSDHGVEDLGDFIGNERDSGKSSACSLEYCDREKAVTNRVKRECVQEIATRKRVVLDDVCGSDQIPGVTVSGYVHSTHKSRRSKGLRKKDLNVEHSSESVCAGKTGMNIAAPPSSRILASCSNGFKFAPNLGECGGAKGSVVKPNVEKNGFNDPENCPKNKLGLGGREKNFIRKNIMDLKNKSNRVSYVNNLSSNSEARGTGQNCRRRDISPFCRDRIKLYNKFLR